MTGDVITLPERKVSPDGALCTRLVEACEGDAGRLLDVALLSVVMIRRQ